MKNKYKEIRFKYKDTRLSFQVDTDRLVKLLEESYNRDSIPCMKEHYENIDYYFEQLEYINSNPDIVFKDMNMRYYFMFNIYVLTRFKLLNSDSYSFIE